MKHLSFLLLITALLCGCDNVRTEYASLGEAQEKGAFERGWLPPRLPEGSTCIVENNNLDSNRSKGTFVFPTSATVQYLENMRVDHSAIVTKSSFGIHIVVTNLHAEWSIKLNPNNGKGSYRTRLNE